MSHGGICCATRENTFGSFFFPPTTKCNRRVQCRPTRRRSRLPPSRPTCVAWPANNFQRHRSEGGIPYHLAAIFDRSRLVCWATNDRANHAEVNVLRRLRNVECRCSKRARLTIVVVRIRTAIDGAMFRMSRQLLPSSFRSQFRTSLDSSQTQSLPFVLRRFSTHAPVSENRRVWTQWSLQETSSINFR